MPPRHTWERRADYVYFVLPAGIEPAFAPSEGAVLSTERRELAHTLSGFHALGGKFSISNPLRS